MTSCRFRKINRVLTFISLQGLSDGHHAGNMCAPWIRPTTVHILLCFTFLNVLLIFCVSFVFSNKVKVNPGPAFAFQRLKPSPLSPCATPKPPRANNRNLSLSSFTLLSLFQKSPSVMWSSIPTSGTAVRLIQSVLLLVIIFSLFHGLQHSHSTGQSVVNYSASKHPVRFQDVFKLPTFNGSRIFSYHASGNSAEATNQTGSTTLPEARRIRPREMLDRPLPVDRTKVPMVIHQSWKNNELPDKFVRWSTSCRQKNPDWEYVLWTDEDNYRIIKKYVPWFLQTYRDLPSEIYRADAMRNVYMHVFGG